ncbi:MAG TPA: helix-turn-helix transcriptional regulator [Acidobacteriaceae bacterium]|jgi:transcriptional regulator with XRE-family HTH domain
MATGKIAENIAAPSICVRIGIRVRDLRTEKGWSQRMLADHAQIEQAHLARLENGLVEPGVIVLERIAKVLGVEAFELLR